MGSFYSDTQGNRMKGVVALVLLGVVAASPVPAPQLGALKTLLSSLSGDDKPGEVNGDYQQVPYETLQKLDGYEERRYPSVKWACTEATYDVEDDDEEDGDGSEEWSIMRMMQMMTNKKSWKKKAGNRDDGPCAVQDDSHGRQDEEEYVFLPDKGGSEEPSPARGPRCEN